MIRHFSVVMLLGMTATMGSGCLKTAEQGDGKLEHAQLIPLICDPYFRVGCRTLQNGTYLLENVHLTWGTGDATTAFEIVFLDHDLIVRNVTVTGFERAFWIESTRCNSCNVRFQDVRINGPGEYDGHHVEAPWAEPVGILGLALDTPLPGIYLNDVQIRGFATAAVIMDEPPRSTLSIIDTRVDCLHRGFNLGTKVVVLQNVTIEHCQGTGAEVSAAKLLVTRSSFVQNWQGLYVDSGDVAVSARVESSVFQGNTVGGLGLNQGRMAAKNNAFTGNGFAANPPYPDLRSSVLHAVLTLSGTMWLRGNCFEDNSGWGVASNLLIAQTDTEENWWGAPTPRMGGAIEQNYRHPTVLTPVGSADIVSASAFPATSLAAPPESCDLLPR